MQVKTNWKKLIRQIGNQNFQETFTNEIQEIQVEKIKEILIKQIPKKKKVIEK